MNNNNNNIPEDGPLFRAILKSYLDRINNLKKSIKLILSSTNQCLINLQSNSISQLLLDENLELLPNKFYEKELKLIRIENKFKREKEIKDLIELNLNLKYSYERLKSLELNKKLFEDTSKNYYDQLNKYLSKIESDLNKLSILDLKQNERKLKFESIRIEYYSILESLVESEELNLTTWLKTWSGVPEVKDSIITLEEVQKKRRHEQHTSVARTLSASIIYRDSSNVLAAISSTGGSKGGDNSDNESVGGGGGEGSDNDETGSNSLSASISGGSGFSQVGVVPVGAAASAVGGIGILQETRKRRSSIPSFTNTNNSNSTNPLEKEKEPERKRDRLKLFLKQSLGSTSTSSSLFDPPRSPTTYLEPPSSPPLPAIPTSPPPPITSKSNDKLASTVLLPPPLTPKQELASQARRREGFLFSNLKPLNHTTTGDGGGHYQKLWCVLSEGQLIEFSNWKTNLVVVTTNNETSNSSLNLKYSTAKLSRNVEGNHGNRRFLFEIINQSCRRLFQASNEQEALEWVTAINKSIESLLNGTSSVRHFDASRLTGTSTPFSLHDFGSTTSLISRGGGHHSNHSSSIELPTTTTSSHLSSNSNSSSNNGLLSNRLPFWMGSNNSSNNNSSSSSSNNQLSRKPSSGGGGGGKKLQKDNNNKTSSLLSSLSPSIELNNNNNNNNRNSFSTPTSTPRRRTISNSISEFITPSNSNQNSSILSNSTNSNSNSNSNSKVNDSSTSTSTISNPTTTSSLSTLSSHDKRIEELVFNLVEKIPTLEESLNLKMKNSLLIHELNELEGNNVCCECNNFKVDANWSSWSLGIFLCIRCSGIHRSLGTHISKVRSVELDDWNDEQINSIQKIGNLKAKEYWEARKPKDFILMDSAITEFIKNKYVEKIWIPLPTSTTTPATTSTNTSTNTSTTNSIPIPVTESFTSSTSSPPEVPSKTNELLNGVLKVVGLN